MCNDDVVRWVEWTHGKSDYHLTQALTGHGNFAVYLEKIKKKETKTCNYCNKADDDACHTLFECEQWNVDKKQLD